MKTGVRLGIDVGDRRIGVARSDHRGEVCVPVATIDATADAHHELIALVREWEPCTIYIGLPISLKGTEGPAAQRVRDWAMEFVLSTRAELFDVEVRLVDERSTTIEAQRRLHQAGKSTRESRSAIDQQAAVIILEQALAIERGQGVAAGEEVVST